MKYRSLGRTGLEVSAICLGTMTFGEQNTEADAHQQLDHALGNGVNFIDTAELYAVPPRAETHGLTEEYIGTWLRSRGCREQVILASKVTGPGNFDYIRGGPRLDRSQLRQAVEDSLQRLQTDYLDLYQVHWPQRQTNFFGRLGYEYGPDSPIPIRETLAALNEMVDAGKVRHVGVSNETPWGVSEYLRLADSVGLPRIASIQNPYSLLNRVFEVGLAEFAHREEVGLLAYSPMAMGVLSGKYLDGRHPKGARLTLFERFQRYTSPASNRVVSRYVDLAKRSGLDPAQMALAYVNSRPFVTSTIVGATTMTQLRADIDSIDLELDEEVLSSIEQIHREQPNPAP
jgi:aryl-alcohol dehydrogenase-like predicted oxidoreductase